MRRVNPFQLVTVFCFCLVGIGGVSLSAETQFDSYIAEIAREWKDADVAVWDEAKMIPAIQQRELEETLIDFERGTEVAVVVVTLPSLKGAPLEKFAARLYEAMELGTTGEDAGVMLLVTRMEKQIRIETGYGAEGALTDLKAKRIIDHVMVPYFENLDYITGIELGVGRILHELKPEYFQSSKQASVSGARQVVTQDKPERKLSLMNYAQILVFLTIVAGINIIWVRMVRSHRRNGSIWYGGGGFGSGGGFSGGGGFGGFGGGMSGGGGASGGW